jgi:hypothetical protein
MAASFSRGHETPEPVRRQAFRGFALEGEFEPDPKKFDVLIVERVSPILSS